MKISISTVLIICLIFSCATPKQLQEKDIIISMKKTSCFGTCPVYELIIYKDHTTTLKAEQFMDIQGNFISALKAKEYKQLLSLFESANFFQFEDSYTTNYTDLPTTYLRYNNGKQDKTIMDYSNPPPDLEILEKAVEALVDNLIWRKKD